MPEAKRKVLVLKFANKYDPQDWEDMAKRQNVELVFCTAQTREEFMDYFKNNDIDVVANSYYGASVFGGYTKEMVQAFPSNLKAVCHNGAGYDQIGDIYTYKAKGIIVSHAPHSVAKSTADTAMWLTLAAMRNLYALTQSVRRGEWLGKVPLGHDPEGHVVGIVGMGNIGQLIRDRLQPYGFKQVQYYSRHQLPADKEKNTKYCSSLEELLTTSDIIILSVPLGPQTRHLINAESLKKCKDGVVIVNVARGPVVHEQALVDALASGKVRSAGLDVFEFEPEVHPDLIANENVVLLPHAATWSEETHRNVYRELMANVESVLATGKPISLAKELQD